MYISKFREVSLEKKDTKNNFISEANKMINQNSTATIDNLDEAYIASLMDQLVWAPFPTDSESESERNNFCRFNINHKVIFDYLFKSSYMPV